MYNCMGMDKKQTKEKRVSLTTTIDPKLLEKFRIYCVKKNKPLNFFIEKWIEKLPE
jgi:hypothetical protein